jgi:hypothetical protein
MANRNKGEVSLQAGDKEYTLRFSANALCELEDATGMGINGIAQQLSSVDSMRMRTVIAVVWAGLLDRHPGITKEEAGEIITEATLLKTMSVVSDAFVLTFGKVEDVEAALPTLPGKARKNDSKMVGNGLTS